jgi:hypothetical protein
LKSIPNIFIQKRRLFDGFAIAAFVECIIAVAADVTTMIIAGRVNANDR